jgi:DNA-directed RNA polymerase specialized sigma24 family protein
MLIAGYYHKLAASPIVLLGETISTRLFRGEKLKIAFIGNSDTMEDSLVFKEVLNELPDTDLAILALRSSGFTQQSTANLLGMSRTSVGSKERNLYRELYEKLGIS